MGRISASVEMDVDEGRLGRISASVEMDVDEGRWEEFQHLWRWTWMKADGKNFSICGDGPG